MNVKKIKLIHCGSSAFPTGYRLMSAGNSPSFVTSDDDEQISGKRKLEAILPSEDAISVESAPAKETMKKPRLPGGFSLVNYRMDDDENEEEITGEMTDGLGDNENASDDDEPSSEGLQFAISDGPVTVFSSEHNLNDIQAATASPQPPPNTISETPPFVNNNTDETDPVVTSDHEPALSGVHLLPPEPSGHCSMELQEKVEKVIRKMHYDISYDLNRDIQDNKAFRNPRFVILIVLLK